MDLFLVEGLEGFESGSFDDGEAGFAWVLGKAKFLKALLATRLSKDKGKTNIGISS